MTSNTLHLAALSIPPRLLTLTLGVVREAHGLVALHAEVARTNDRTERPAPSDAETWPEHPAGDLGPPVASYPELDLPEHTPSDDCACDLCRAAREELDQEIEARREEWMDALDADASLPWETDRALDDVDLPLAAHAGLYGAARIYSGGVVSLYVANEPSDEVA